MRNRYPGYCKDCSKWVEAGAGYFEKAKGRGWYVRCLTCVATSKATAGKDLSLAQRRALTHEPCPELPSGECLGG